MSLSRFLTIPAAQALNRREMLKGLAGSAVTVVVSQSLLGCATASNATDTAVDTTSQGGSASTACVLTASLTEGPFFVDEKLNRSDIRSDPVTGAVSAGVPLGLTFNVSRVANSACTPLTGAYLDVWHADAAGTYSDVSGMGNGSGTRGQRNVVNSTDGICNSLTTAQKSALTLQATSTTDGYAGIINLDVNVG